ncbi:hypothetical protein ABIB25_000252 [Nakamurella sp. UYEF19]|uniref:hypothetical protein n=1 Tax=Nakamurella sp. UYEF19 TaxID=1756392 RepID=UPI003398A4BA
MIGAAVTLGIDVVVAPEGVVDGLEVLMGALDDGVAGVAVVAAFDDRGAAFDDRAAAFDVRAVTAEVTGSGPDGNVPAAVRGVVVEDAPAGIAGVWATELVLVGAPAAAWGVSARVAATDATPAAPASPAVSILTRRRMRTPDAAESGKFISMVPSRCVSR